MRPQAPILLHLQSNLERYEVTVYDGKRVYKKRVDDRKDCFCLCPHTPCIRIVATPLESGYSIRNYYWIDVTCKSVFSLYFSFQRNPAPLLPLQAFTLTDETYGLPIDGILQFQSI